MKWTLLLLLVINIALGGYQYWDAQQPEQVVEQGALTKFNNLQLTKTQQQRLNESSERTPVLKDTESLRCIKITGLVADDSLPIVESRLKALEVVAKKVTDTIVLRRDYQVILGPFASIDLARAELTKISAKGVESYVITTGDNKNALSLGVFSNDANAKRKIDELSQLDITAKTIIKEHTGTTTNLVIDKDSAALLSDTTLESILSAFENTEFSRFLCN